jgi:hypothetical protein
LPTETGAVRFADESKSISFFPAEHTPGGVILALDGVTEFGERAPERGDPWPNVLLSRRLPPSPRLPDLGSVPLRLRYRLLHARPDKAKPGWDDRRHTAQFVFYVTVQNLNSASPGHGDYLWFGFLLYDMRFRMPKAFAARDTGSEKKVATGKFMVQPAFERFSKVSPHDGDWITIATDLLPMLHDALELAWSRGYLPDSRDVRDYGLGGMNTGWEITGPVDAALHLAELSLQAVTTSSIDTKPMESATPEPGRKR